MSEITDRVAKAIMDKLPIGFMAEYQQEIARAAIAAMREPTAEMVSAGELSPFDCSSEVTWKAMVDEALK